MTKEESLKILQSVQERLENMSDEEKEALRKDAEEFFAQEESEESKEENELRRDFLEIII